MGNLPGDEQYSVILCMCCTAVCGIIYLLTVDVTVEVRSNTSTLSGGSGSEEAPENHPFRCAGHERARPARGPSAPHARDPPGLASAADN